MRRRAMRMVALLIMGAAIRPRVAGVKMAIRFAATTTSDEGRSVA
jgi:hypothetical protein